MARGRLPGVPWQTIAGTPSSAPRWTNASVRPSRCLAQFLPVPRVDHTGGPAGRTWARVTSAGVRAPSSFRPTSISSRSKREHARRRPPRRRRRGPRGRPAGQHRARAEGERLEDVGAAPNAAVDEHLDPIAGRLDHLRQDVERRRHASRAGARRGSRRRSPAAPCSAASSASSAVSTPLRTSGSSQVGSGATRGRARSSASRRCRRARRAVPPRRARPEGSATEVVGRA